MNLITKTYFLLSQFERRRLIFLLVISAIVTMLDLVGIASIMPFIALLTNPQLIKTNPLLSRLYDLGWAGDAMQFQIWVGVLSLVLLVVSGVSRAFTNYINLRFLMSCEAGISSRLVARYLNQPYVWFLARHSANLNKLVLSEVPKVIGEIMAPAVALFTQGIFLLLLLVLLCFIDPMVTFIAGLGFVTIYLLLGALTKSLTVTHGRQRFSENERRFRLLSDALGGIREVKAGSAEYFFSSQFHVASYAYAHSHSKVSLIHALPRYVMEIVSMGGMLGYLIVCLIRGESMERVLPVASVFAFAAYRLLPVLQNIFTSLGQIRFAAVGVEALHRDYASTDKGEVIDDCVNLPHYQRSLRLKNVDFSYPNVKHKTLKSISIDIPRGAYIGLVGPSGGGKSTTVDILIGLLKPERGTVLVDDYVVELSRQKEWCRRHFGYIPQQIFLSDDSVASNIAFSVNKNDIDQDLVRKAARLARIDTFIEKDLPHGYQTMVGERGLRLSGGQRQRIGIARALYHQPSLLVFDEGTNAIDTQTEQMLIQELRNSLPNLSILIIAHRLDALASCDVVYCLDQGCVVAKGRLEELRVHHAMAGHFIPEVNGTSTQI